MPKGHVMSRAFLIKPMKDTVVDYTWRVHGKEVLVCPVCKKAGTPRILDEKVTMIHKEIISDYMGSYVLEACEADSDEIQLVLIRKEKARVYALERSRQQAGQRAAKKSACIRRLLEKHMNPTGQSIVELSLLIPLLCLLLFGTLDLGRLIQAQARVSNAAHLAMRDVQNVEDTSGTAAVSVPAVQTAVTGDFPGVVVTISPSIIYSNETVVITVTTPFHMVTPFVRNMVNQTSITQVITGTTLP